MPIKIEFEVDDSPVVYTFASYHRLPFEVGGGKVLIKDCTHEQKANLKERLEFAKRSSTFPSPASQLSTLNSGR